MPSWCSLLWGWSETAFILVVAVNETLLPLKNTLAANNQEGQDERKPPNRWQVTVIPQLMKLETKLIDLASASHITLGMHGCGMMRPCCARAS